MNETIFIKIKHPNESDIKYVRELFKKKKIFRKDLRPNMTFIDGMGRKIEEEKEEKEEKK